jgi:hypothetical protein
MPSAHACPGGFPLDGIACIVGAPDRIVTAIQGHVAAVAPEVGRVIGRRGFGHTLAGNTACLHPGAKAHGVKDARSRGRRGSRRGTGRTTVQNDVQVVAVTDAADAKGCEATVRMVPARQRLGRGGIHGVPGRSRVAAIRCIDAVHTGRRGIRHQDILRKARVLGHGGIGRERRSIVYRRRIGRTIAGASTPANQHHRSACLFAHEADTTPQDELEIARTVWSFVPLAADNADVLEHASTVPELWSLARHRSRRRYRFRGRRCQHDGNGKGEGRREEQDRLDRRLRPPARSKARASSS